MSAASIGSPRRRCAAYARSRSSSDRSASCSHQSAVPRPASASGVSSSASAASKPSRALGQSPASRASRAVVSGASGDTTQPYARPLARLVPFVPMSLVGYVAGAARVPLWRCTWTTVVGLLPITAAATYLGQALDGFSLSDPFVWLATGVLVVLVATTLVGARHLGRSPRQPSPKG